MGETTIMGDKYKDLVMSLPGKSLTALMKAMPIPQSILEELAPKMTRYNWDELCQSQDVDEAFLRKWVNKISNIGWRNMLTQFSSKIQVSEQFIRDFDHKIPVDVFERINLPLSQDYIGLYLMNLPRSTTKKRILNNVLFDCYDLTEEFVEKHWDTVNEENINGIMSINYSPQFIIEHWSDLVKNVNLLSRQVDGGKYIDQDIYQTDEILLLRRLTNE